VFIKYLPAKGVIHTTISVLIYVNARILDIVEMVVVFPQQYADLRKYLMPVNLIVHIESIFI